MGSITYALTSAALKVVIWIVPVLCFIKIVEKEDFLTYLGLRHLGMKWIGIGSFLLIAYFFIIHFIVLHRPIDFRLGFDEWLNTVLLVGITEEIVFRGFILKKLMASYKFWLANTMTAFLFLFIHFPIWFYKGLFEFPSILSASFTVFLLGLIFGYVYKKSGSLWPVIVIHSLYDLFVSIFY